MEIGMTSSDKQSLPQKARRRALRAAQVVTLGLAMAGCYGRHEPPTESPTSRPIDDDGGVFDDDGASPAPDAAMADAGTDAAADAGRCDPAGDWEEYTACCDANGWNWDWGCMAWGPFVPPADGDLPAPRSAIEIA